MLGSPNRPNRDIFEFSCLRLLVHLSLLQFQPISEGRKIEKYHELADWVIQA